MNTYKIINLDNKKEWNEIVRSFEKYDVMYLAEYAEAFKLNGDGEPLLFYYDDGNTRAIDVIMKRCISNIEIFNNYNNYYDLSTPYGYGGIYIEGNNYNEVNIAYEEFCKNENIICEFVRFNLFNEYYKQYNGCIEKIKHNVIRKLDIPIEDMFMQFEHKVRKNVKRANANNLKFEVDREGKTIKEFLDIYYKTMNRNLAENEYYFKKEFFDMINKLEDNKIYFNVLYENKIISTELVVYTQYAAYSFLGGTLNEYFNLRPNDFLKYKIIEWLQNNNIKNFILGGGYGREDDGIFQYKKSFSPDGIVDFYIGKKIFNKDRYNELVNIRKLKDGKFNENSSYFPLYRS